MLSTEHGFAPRISRAEFDHEATLFLEKYYPEALQRPMAVPILEVARKRMGLRVVEKHLSEDLSILGQMCFNSGVTDIYDKENDEYIRVKVRYGTIIIDPDVLAVRNEGCMNNTVAHECFHWHKHRDYHIATSIREDSKAISRYCDFMMLSEDTQSDWTDVEWMEWQANNIAPRILMPLDQFLAMAQKFFTEYHDDIDVRRSYYSARAWLKYSLSEFFKVSKQSAGIRLEEAGYYF